MHDSDRAVVAGSPFAAHLAAFSTFVALVLTSSPAWAAQGLFGSARRITDTILAVVLVATALFALVVGGVMLLKRMHRGPGDTRIESEDYERRHV